MLAQTRALWHHITRIKIQIKLIKCKEVQEKESDDNNIYKSSMEKQTGMKVVFILINQDSMIHLVNVIQIQQNKMNSEMMKLYILTISLSKFFKTCILIGSH